MLKKRTAEKQNLVVNTAVYVPNTDRYGRRVPELLFKRRVREVEGFLLKLFGTYTVEELRHSEVPGKKSTTNQKIAHIQTFAEAKTHKLHKNSLETWLMRKKREWNQESLSYEFEGKAHKV